MAKSITIKEDSLMVIKENMVGSRDTASHNTVCVMEAMPEVDEFELGQETDNPPVGGNYCHVNETYNVSMRGDMDKVDYIDYVPHDNAREEGYTVDNMTEFTPYYELMCYGVDGDVIFSGELTLNELFDYFPDRIIHMMSNREGRKVSQAEYRIEDILSWNTKPNNIDDVEEVNAIAKRIQQEGPSYYLLTDGDMVSFLDHIQITSIEGMTPSKFVGLGNIRIGKGFIELSKEPNRQQLSVLKDFLRGEDEIYLDIVKDDGKMYPTCICSAAYKNTHIDRVINDIIYYFEDGIRPQGNIRYESKRKYKNLIENIDFEVNSSDIDLSSFKKKNQLAPIWNEQGELNLRIRLKLLDIADDFWEFVNLKWVKPSGVILTGSICNFNWSKFSDIDLHLIVDFDEIDEKTEFVRDYLDAKKNEWNNEHEDLKILDYPVELYVQNLEEMPKSGGIYDLEEDKWLKKPNADDIKSIGLNKFSIKDKAANIMTIIDDMYDALNSTSDSYEIETIGDDAKYLWKKVKNMRKKGLETQGESSSANIVYKILRRTNYLEKLWKLSTIVYDRSNSIFESKEVIKEYLDKDYNLPLYKYFKWATTASDEEKVRDIIYQCSYDAKNYVDKMSHQNEIFLPFREELIKDEEIIYDDNFVEQLANTIVSNGLTKAFMTYLQYYSNEYELPSWMFMDFNRIVKNEWCIHFGADSDSIAKEGFTGGTPEIEHLAYTNAGSHKSHAGYDFAFLIDDKSVDYNEYGDEAVIFRTSGIEIYHYGDNQNQVVFWGPNVKSFIPIHQEDGDWVVYGQNGQVLVRCGRPSEIAIWATENLPQYRKQIMAGKNGYIPKYYDYRQKKHVPYPIYRNESVQKYITLLKEQAINEESVADGSSKGNPYDKRWKTERKALKDFICNYGTLMQSKEDDKQGRLYKCFWDKTLSNLIGYNYCLAVQWDEINNKPKSTIYVRACDRFTRNIRRNIQYDTSGRDNQIATADDLRYGNQQQNNYQYQ